MTTGLMERLRSSLSAQIDRSMSILPEGTTRTHRPSHRDEIARVFDIDPNLLGLPTRYNLTDPLQHSSPVAVRQIPEMPSTSMLKAMETPETASTARQELAIAVEDLLGYTPLRKDAGAPSKLQRVLAELEITAFDPATVLEYKSKMQAHFQAKADDLDVRDIGQANPQMMGAFDMRFFLSPVEAMRFGRLVGTRVSWNEVELRFYQKPVPEFVLNKAMQIKRHAPEARFFVDELREDKVTLDPFLVVKIDDEMAHIEVWDEPEFEKKLYDETP